MKELERTEKLGETGLLQDNVVNRIVELLHKIDDKKLLSRIYRFVQYIYIHKV